MEEEAAVWIDLFVWMVGLQCPSHLCVDFAPLRLLYLVFIYKSIRKKNTQLGDMYRNIDKRESPSNTQAGGGSIEQCRLNRSKWVNKTFEMHFGVMVLYGFWSYSIICPTFSLSCCTFLAYAAQTHMSIVCEDEAFCFLLKMNPIAPETVTSHWQGDSEKETILNLCPFWQWNTIFHWNDWHNFKQMCPSILSRCQGKMRNIWDTDLC